MYFGLQVEMQREQANASHEAHASHVVHEENPEGTKTKKNRKASKSGHRSKAAKEQLALQAQYIELFLMKYICTAPDCFGTLVPHSVEEQLGGCKEGSMTCNVCGYTRTEAEFMRDVEKLLSESVG
jgi:hypothetical protein